MMIITPVGRLPGQSGTMVFLELVKNQKALDAAVAKIEGKRLEANDAIGEANEKMAAVESAETDLRKREEALSEALTALAGQETEHQREVAKHAAAQEKDARDARERETNLNDRKAGLDSLKTELNERSDGLDERQKENSAAQGQATRMKKEAEALMDKAKTTQREADEIKRKARVLGSAA